MAQEAHQCDAIIKSAQSNTKKLNQNVFENQAEDHRKKNGTITTTGKN